MTISFFDKHPLPPAPKTLGWQLLAEYPEQGQIEIAFQPNETMLNARSTVQGGFLAAMLDDTMGPALVSMTGGKEMPVTIDMNVTFIRAAGLGRLMGKGRVISRTKNIAFLEGELFDDEGLLVARATSTAKIILVE